MEAIETLLTDVRTLDAETRAILARGLKRLAAIEILRQGAAPARIEELDGEARAITATLTTIAEVKAVKVGQALAGLIDVVIDRAFDRVLGPAPKKS